MIETHNGEYSERFKITKRQLFSRLSDAYSDDHILFEYAFGGRRSGDTLAQFIYREVIDFTDGIESNPDRPVSDSGLRDARNAILKATEQLHNVLNEFDKIIGED